MTIKKPLVDRKDLLFLLGGLLVVAGVGVHSLSRGLITAGILLLAVPALELVSGFIRGLRS